MDSSSDLDPRIQVELETLNSATDEINKLEIELEEAIATFNILSNESTRRLKQLKGKLGNSCIEKSRPYYDAVEKARLSQIECQKAAVKFQRANEYYAASKETVALAEQRFMSNSHEWQFDNAWQEMLNHATIKVMEAETQKTESGLEHHNRALIFNAAELKVQQLEEKLKRNILKSRPYFEENQICQDQLKTQKARIAELQGHIQQAKTKYSTALRSLEAISEDIHRQRGDLPGEVPQGPREPGVGAELSTPVTEESGMRFPEPAPSPEPKHLLKLSTSECNISTLSGSELPSEELHSEEDSDEEEEDNEELAEDHVNKDDQTIVAVVPPETAADDEALDALRRQIKVLAIRPVEGGEGKQHEQSSWEDELNATVNKLDHLMMVRELNLKCGGGARNSSTSAPTTPQHNLSHRQQSPASRSPPPPIKMLKRGAPLPATNSSLNELSVAKLMPYVLPFPPSSPSREHGSRGDLSIEGVGGGGPSGKGMQLVGSSSGNSATGSAKDQKRKLSI